MQENEILRLAEHYKLLRQEKEQTEEHLKALNSQIEQTVYKLSELMLENDMPGFKHKGAQYSLSTVTRASAIAGAKEELYQALRENGFGDLVYETVNANSLSSFVREQTELNGDTLPEWLLGKVNVYEKTTVKLQKS
jgi:hypothetical protein